MCTALEQKGGEIQVLLKPEIKTVRILECPADGQHDIHCIHMNSPSLSHSLLHPLSLLTVDAWLINTPTFPLTYICPTCVSQCGLTHIPADAVI